MWGHLLFGALRFLLSYLVVLSHLAGSTYLAHFGFYAVRGFFVISGFIMTAALNEVYRFDGVRFWTNRMLRLLPPYYVVCALTLLAVTLLPVQAGEYLKQWHHDIRAGDVLMNLLILPLQFPETEFRFLPPYWSIAVEIVMYVMLWLAISRHAVFAAIALAAGIAFHIASMNFEWGVRYFTAPSAVLSFSLGALVYFFRKWQIVTIGPGATVAALAAWFGNMAAGGWLLPESYVFGAGYYLATICFTVVVAGLAGQKSSPSIDALDHALGTLAYPIFLLQWLVGFVAAVVLLPGAWRGWQLIMVATPLLLAAGYGLSQLHDAFIEPVRRRVRDDGKPTPEFSQPCGIELATGSGRSTDRLGNQALQSRQIWP